jgi:hypothetical protein
MAHDSIGIDDEETGLLRSGAGNRDEKINHGNTKENESAKGNQLTIYQSTMTRLIVNVGELKFSSSPRCK